MRERLKALLPTSALDALRDRRGWILTLPRDFRTRRDFSDNSLSADVLAFLGTAFRPGKTILFFPERPEKQFVSYKLCALLGYAITTNVNRRFDAALRHEDATFFDPAVLRTIPGRPGDSGVINARLADISKHAVARAFADVFGYGLEVDPTEYRGRIVEKSNRNAAHDGRLLAGPVAPETVRPDCVYQKAIDNTSEDGLVLDYRLPVHGGRIPLVYLKYRPVETRFSNTNALVRLGSPSEAFSEAELERILSLAAAMGVDYGEFDVLRDKDGRIYVVDINNTPNGPPNGLPVREAKRAMTLLAKSFDRLLGQRR